MTCEICGKKEAVVHIQQIVGEDVYDLHLCETCAQEKGISSQADKIELSLSEILTGLLDSSDASQKRKQSLMCPKCGKKYEDFRKEGTFGCVECFNIFSAEVKVLLKNTCGSVRHTGKYPSKLAVYKTLLIDKEMIKQKLKAELKRENYEEAARLRDRILEIEKSSSEQETSAKAKTSGEDDV